MKTSTVLQHGAVRIRVLVIGVAFVAVILISARFLKRTKPVASSMPVPAAVVEIARTNLILEAGRLRLKDGTNFFTGLMVEYYLNGALRSRTAVSNGLLHGLSEGWYTNGQRQVSEHFRDGVSHGIRTKWYDDGATQSVAQIADGRLNGTFRKWHPNGVLSEQAEFLADRPEGVSSAWFPSGYLKARVVMKNGQSVEQTFWKDGEKKE